MSVLARRAREQDEARHRALLGLGDAVFAAVTEEMPRAGSLAVEEAVEAALKQILRKGAHRCDLEFAKRWWISWAKLRMIDGRRLSAFRDRDLIPIDEHPAALAYSITEDPLALDGEGLDAAGLQEILSTLSGRQREWADGLFWLLRQPAIDGSPAAKLHEVLGWSPEMTRKTGQRARETIRAFIEDRASGVICSRRQAVLDAFIMATEAGLRSTAGGDVDVDCRQFQAVVVHLAGCPECQAVWSRRRATMLARCASIALLPIDAFTAAAQAFAGKLAGALSGAQNAALSVLARLGIGGGGVVAGGSALTGKTAAVCVGIVCAAGAGTAELSGVLPPIAPDRTRVTRQQAKRRTPPAKRAPAPKTLRAAASAAVAPAPPPPPPPPPSVRPTTRTATPPPPSPAVSTPQFTPGDLEPTSSASATAPPPPPPPPPVAATSSSCTPGDLGC
jgi:hypothetical protein